VKKLIIFLVIFTLFIVAQSSAQEQEGIEYKTVTVRKTDCDIGILYRRTPEGMEIQVAAMAIGQGADFRKWEVTDIKLDIDGNIIRPVEFNKFYGRKESVFRVPAAVIFAAIGLMYEQYAYEYSGSGVRRVEQGAVARTIDKVGMAAGLGLLASQAKGDITGLKSTFKLDNAMADKIDGKNDIVKLIVENREQQQKERMETTLSVLTPEEPDAFGKPAKQES